jgi:UDP-GlcNAc:undecaprenyl-phosphate/decaprenyl-phosphate GlcNAc-1-phosphate transferase
MSSVIIRDVATFGAALVASAAITPAARRIALRTGIVDTPAPHKHHRRTTPYLGGLAITAPVLVVLALQLLSPRSIHGQTIAIGLGAMAVGAVGFIDDWRVLGPAPRLAAQTGAAALLWISGIRLTPTGVPAIDLAVTVFVVLAVTNAFNLLDNMDGLAAGTAAIAASFFFVAAVAEGQHLVGAMALAVAGGCLGFLPYNFHPARIFLGDTGSLFLGFLLSVLFIKIGLVGYPLVTRAAVPALIVGVAVFDTTLVIWSRWRGGRPVFQGGTDHSSHRLHVLVGSPARVALLTYAGAVATGTVASLLLLTHAAWPAWIAVAAAITLGTIFLLHLERVFERDLLVRMGSVTEVRRTQLPQTQPVHGLHSYRRAS